MGKLLFVIIIVLILVGFFIVKINSLDLKDSEDQKEFASLYGNWLFKVAQNIKTITGEAIQQDWSINDTNSTS